MKKLCIAVGILFLIGGIACLGESFSTFLFGVIVGGVLLYLGFRKKQTTMLQTIIIVIPVMVVLAGITALIQRFGALFIILGILCVAGLIAYLFLKKKKSSTPKASIANAERSKAQEEHSHPITVPKDADAPTPVQATTPDAKPEDSKTVVNSYEVTGIVFYLNNLLDMMEPNYLWNYKKQDLIDTCNYDIPIYKTTIPEFQLNLSHEPDNPHDPNAIMVLFNDRLVGYIAAKDCKHILNIMDNDLMVSMTCEVRGGKYKMVTEDYDWEKDKSKYTMEYGEDEYGITIYIREKIV